MTERSEITDDDIQDYIDGRLDATQAAIVEAALSRDPALARKVADYRAQNEAVRQVYEPALSEPVPERLLQTVRGARRKQTSQVMWRIAASFALIAVGAAGGWYGNDVVDKEGLLAPFIEQAKLAHEMATIQPSDGLELELDRDDNNSISSRYIPANFGIPVRIPALKRANLTPISTVSAVDPAGPRMTITYADRQKRRRTLFIRKLASGDDLPVKYRDESGTPVLYWIDGPLIYVLVGEGDKDELVTIAEEIYKSSATRVPKRTSPSR